MAETASATVVAAAAARPPFLRKGLGCLERLNFLLRGFDLSRAAQCSSGNAVAPPCCRVRRRLAEQGVDGVAAPHARSKPPPFCVHARRGAFATTRPEDSIGAARS